MAVALNPRGQVYDLVPHPSGDATQVSFDGKTIWVPMTLDQVKVAWRAWVGGMLIQRAFPTLTPPQREFLMTGITPDEWEAIFPPEEDTE